VNGRCVELMCCCPYENAVGQGVNQQVRERRLRRVGQEAVVRPTLILADCAVRSRDGNGRAGCETGDCEASTYVITSARPSVVRNKVDGGLRDPGGHRESIKGRSSNHI
jgi:hypothetical protein